MNNKAIIGGILALVTIVSMIMIYQIQESRITGKQSEYNSNFKQISLCIDPRTNTLINMKATKVQYTVKPEFTETNASNIRQVMKDLRQLNNDKIKYSSFVLPDQVSFVHFVLTTSEGSDILANLASFKKFQSELKASEPPVPPQVEKMTLIGSSYDFFNE